VTVRSGCRRGRRLPAIFGRGGVSEDAQELREVRGTKNGRRGCVGSPEFEELPATEADSGELNLQQPGGAFERGQRGNGEEVVAV